MGITNLLKTLNKIKERRSLNDFKHKRAGIDGYYFLHRSIYALDEEIFTEPNNLTKATNFLTKILTNIQQYDITPIIVFDGAIPELKLEEISDRAERRHNDSNEAESLYKQSKMYNSDKLKIEAITKKKNGFKIDHKFALKFISILKDMKIEYYVAPYEADSELAYLSKINYIDFVITVDSDLIAYGCKCVFTKLGDKGANLMYNEGYSFYYEKVKTFNHGAFDFNKFTYDKFLKFCLLCGCDYIKINGIGPKRAYECLYNSNNDNEVFENIRKFANQKSNDFCILKEKFEKAFLMFKFSVVYDPVSKCLKHFNDINDSNYKHLFSKYTNLDFLGKFMKEDILQDYIQGDIDPHTFKYVNSNHNKKRSTSCNNTNNTNNNKNNKNNTSNNNTSSSIKRNLSCINNNNKVKKYIKRNKKSKDSVPDDQALIDSFIVQPKDKSISKLKSSKKTFKQYKEENTNIKKYIEDMDKRNYEVFNNIVSTNNFELSIEKYCYKPEECKDNYMTTFKDTKNTVVKSPEDSEQKYIEKKDSIEMINPFEYFEF